MKLEQKIADTIDSLTLAYGMLDKRLEDARELLSQLNENESLYDFYDINGLINDLEVHLELLTRYEKIEKTLK